MQPFYKKPFHGVPVIVFFIDKTEAALTVLGNFGDTLVFRDFRSAVVHLAESCHENTYLSTALYIGGEYDVLYYKNENCLHLMLESLTKDYIPEAPSKCIDVDEWGALATTLQGFLLPYRGEPMVAYGFSDDILNGITSFHANPHNLTYVLPDIFSAFKYVHIMRERERDKWQGGFVYHGPSDKLFIEGDRLVLEKTVSFLKMRILHLEPCTIIPIADWATIPCS